MLEDNAVNNQWNKHKKAGFIIPENYSSNICRPGKNHTNLTQLTQCCKTEKLKRLMEVTPAQP